MDKQLYEQLRKDLKRFIEEKNYEKVEQIKRLLSLTDEQNQYIFNEKTGFPSLDMPWLKFYKKGAYEDANDIPKNKIVWEVIEEKLKEYYDIPALEYFKQQITREEFIDSVYKWARTFKALGIEPDEVIPVYGPFTPDVCAMTLALNVIGAVAYFLKLAISPESLEEETRDSKVAIVYDGMWKNVRKEFSKDKFKKIIVTTITNDMPSPKKEIVSFINYIQCKKDKSGLPNDKKYIWVDMAKQISDYYTGNVKEKFVPNRSTFITSSSGTTINGVVKGTVATNESTLTQLRMGKSSEIRYFPGDRCLNSLPPTASTSLNVLFLYGLYQGMTVVLDPRVSEKDFYNQIIELKPNIALTTGSMWESFFNRVNKEMKQGKKFDFSYAKGWTIGGEGSDPKKIDRWKEIMKKANSTDSIFSGYGSSELFSAISVEKLNAKDYTDNSKSVMNVGIPYAGLNVGVFNSKGEELSYGKRGELWIKSNSAMKEYYGKKQLTSKTLIDGWIHTGDLAEIDENGFIYVWGRVNDKLSLNDGTSLYLFDIANKIKENSYIDDAIVLSMPSEEENTLVAHIVWNEFIEDTEKLKEIETINNSLEEYLNKKAKIIAYSEHEYMLPFSPTTLKKDKNKLSKQLNNYFQLTDGKLYKVVFLPTKNNTYKIKYDIIEKNKSLIKK